MSYPSDIRGYFDERIKSIDPDLIPLEDALNDEVISQSEADKGYKMVLGNISMITGPQFHTESCQILLTIYTRPKRDELGTYDELYCKAQDIKDSIVNRINQQNYSSMNWNEIAPTSMVPSSEDTDDKLFKIELEFSVRRDIAYT